MRLGRRKLWRIISREREKALTEGRCEMANFICHGLGRRKALYANNPAMFNALLYAQAFAEGNRLLAYFCDEMTVEDVRRFEGRFIKAGLIELPDVPKFDRDAISTLINPGEIHPETFWFAALVAVGVGYRDKISKDFGTFDEGALEYRRQKDSGILEMGLGHHLFQTIYRFFSRLPGIVNPAPRHLRNAGISGQIVNADEVTPAINYFGGHNV